MTSKEYRQQQKTLKDGQRLLQQRNALTWKLRKEDIPYQTVKAWTKSEARSFLRKKLKLKKLPVGFGKHLKRVTSA